MAGGRRDPWLSIIIPVLNEGSVIKACLDRLQAWREQGVEVILSDGGSDDDTVLQAVHRVDRLCVGAPGRGVQLHAGAIVARAPLLVFLHVDTELSDEALLALRSMSGTDVWGGFNVRLSGSHRAFRVIERFISWRSRWTGMLTGDQAIFVSHTLYQASGGFLPLRLMEDLELSRRLRRIRWPRRPPGVVITSSRRWETRGILRTILLMWQLRLLYFLGVPSERLWRDYR